MVTSHRRAHRTILLSSLFAVVPRLPPFVRYAIAVSAALLATLLRVAFDPLWGFSLPFITAFPAVMVSAWLGGFGPGLVTTVICAAAVQYLFLPPVYSFALDAPSEAVALLLFGASGVVISGLNEAWRRAATAVLQSEQRLTVTLASIGDAVITTDEKGRIAKLNRVAESLTGWTHQEAEGRPLSDVFAIFNEETRQSVENPAQRVLREGVIVGLANHTILVSKDGRDIPIDDSAAPIKSEEGTISGVVIVFRDVTERRRTERERTALLEQERAARATAEAAEERLQIALQAGRMGTWQYMIRTGQVSWSSSLEAIHGLAPGAFPGTIEAFQSEIHQDDREKVLQAISEAIEQRRVHQVEYRIVRADGAVRWVEGRGQLYFDEAGQPDRMIGVCSDITNRKRDEEKFRLAVEAAPAAMILVDRRGSIQMVNRLVEHLLGYGRDELVGQPIERLIPFRFRDGHVKLRNAFLGDPDQRPMGLGRDLFALRKDGSEVPVEIGLSPIETADGLFVLAAVTDISQRQRASARLERALEAERLAKQEAQRANQLKDQFLATVSHELRAPLNAVLGWAEMLQVKDALDAPRRERALQSVHANAKRQAQLIDDLLDVASIASGKMSIARARVDLGSVIRSALDVVEPVARAKGIHLQTDIDESVGAVLGDAGRLQQVLWNLLINAVKFTPENGLVRLTVRRSENTIEIAVFDTGKGIPPEFLPSVFEPFRQADSSISRKYGGLGLGLAIAKHIVEAHDGTISAESRGDGQGSTFTVRLPLVAVYFDQATSSPVTRAVGADVAVVTRALERVSVLVVDDDADSRDLLAAYLEGHGATVLVASSADNAFEILERSHVDVILSDIAMPSDDGYEFIRKVRASESPWSQVPAAALTSFTHEEHRRRALQAGFRLHLKKPIDSRTLVEAVASLASEVEG